MVIDTLPICSSGFIEDVKAGKYGPASPSKGQEMELLVTRSRILAGAVHRNLCPAGL